MRLMKSYGKSEQKKEIRVVLDTNIIISAFLSKRGLPSKIVKLVVDKAITNVISPQIMEEIYIVLTRNSITSRISLVDMIFALEVLIKESIIVHTLLEHNVFVLDSSDNKLIDCARAAGALCVISGDRNIVRKVSYQGILFLSPIMFMEKYPQLF